MLRHICANLSLDGDGWRLNKNRSRERERSVPRMAEKQAKLFKMCNISYLSYRVCSSERDLLLCSMPCVCVCAPVHLYILCWLVVPCNPDLSDDSLKQIKKNEKCVFFAWPNTVHKQTCIPGHPVARRPANCALLLLQVNSKNISEFKLCHELGYIWCFNYKWVTFHACVLWNKVMNFQWFAMASLAKRMTQRRAKTQGHKSTKNNMDIWFGKSDLLISLSSSLPFHFIRTAWSHIHGTQWCTVDILTQSSAFIVILLFFFSEIRHSRKQQPSTRSKGEAAEEEVEGTSTKCLLNTV